MKIVREQKKSKFEEMRERAKREVKNRDEGSGLMTHMGKLKTFGELADSITKLR